MPTALAEQRSAHLTLSPRRAMAATVAAWTLGFAAPLYLALKGGGYEEVLRDQVGIAVWWIVLVGALVGVLPAAKPSRAQLTALGALVALAAWSGLGAMWSQSSGRTVAELSRLSCYAAVLALGITAVKAGAKSALIGGVACAIGGVAALALLSRLHPAWFPADETARFFGASRLNSPLNYWNGVAAFVAMGVPLMVHLAASARRLVPRMLAAAALPVLAGTIYLTFSRGGWIELGAAIVVLMALSTGRVWRLATLAIGAAGGGLLIAAIHQRPAIDQGLLSTAGGRAGGSELIAIALVVCAGVALLQGAVVLLEDHVEAGRAMSPGRAFLPRAPTARVVLAILAVTFVAGVFVLAGGPHTVADSWSSFKNATNTAPASNGPAGRLLSLSGEGRYQYWVSAVHAFTTDPIGGVGAGTFQFWWAAHGSIYSYVINAHSLYFETLGETGLVGIALLVLLLGTGIVGALRRMRRAHERVRAEQAAIVAAIVAFMVAASVDWVWQIPAIPVAALLLLAGGVAGETKRGLGLGEENASPVAANGRSATATIAWVGLAAVGTAAIVVPMASAVSVRSSQSQAQTGSLTSALHSAKTAAGWQPYASEPALQQALVLEQARNFTAAATQARKATESASTDWRAWLVRSRIEAERGAAKQALVAWEKAKSLDPNDPLFAGR